MKSDLECAKAASVWKSLSARRAWIKCSDNYSLSRAMCHFPEMIINIIHLNKIFRTQHHPVINLKMLDKHKVMLYSKYIGKRCI